MTFDFFVSFTDIYQVAPSRKNNVVGEKGKGKKGKKVMKRSKLRRDSIWAFDLLAYLWVWP
ncbi:hypothetical protein AKJ45_03200 [candidate division MSBL1 archaeon SCGC-AAA261F19]|uniref:Uncharacterized protein n=1 Tax=candidate division MSBL1 archaeon SCGC-AAA261F19 TaxID=1698275 RepID=A0A133V8Z0_9EURY|nr:hypothetical protein AKJ45_03200 [candidate division MSBL1 archaeon SCGC-AAA261F19]